MSAVGAQIHITGIVQGVGYRDFCRRRALELELTGWVRNQPDGSVMALAEGDKAAIETLITKLTSGPPAAKVKNVDVDWRKASGAFAGFSVTY